MASDINFKLSGPGVQISYSAGTTALEIVLADSWGLLNGTYQPDVTETVPDEYGFSVTGTISRTTEPHREWHVSLTVYLPGYVDQDAPAEVAVTAAVVLITSPIHRYDLPAPPHVLPTFRAETLTGTLTRSVAVTGGR